MCYFTDVVLSDGVMKNPSFENKNVKLCRNQSDLSMAKDSLTPLI